MHSFKKGSFILINLLEEKPVNIAGVMFVAHPTKVEQVAKELAEFPGAEVHVTGDTGNLVVTIEEEITNPKKSKLIDTITNMSHVHGVISSSLIFHHNDAGLPQYQGENL